MIDRSSADTAGPTGERWQTFVRNKMWALGANEALEMEKIHDQAVAEQASILALVVFAIAWWALAMNLIAIALALGFAGSAGLALAAKARLDLQRHDRLRKIYFRGERP